METSTEKGACEEWEYRLARTMTKSVIKYLGEVIKNMEYLIPLFKDYIQSLNDAIDSKFKPHAIHATTVPLIHDLGDLIELAESVYHDVLRLAYTAECMAVRDCYDG